jgi:hypothetical protein
LGARRYRGAWAIPAIKVIRRPGSPGTNVIRHCRAAVQKIRARPAAHRPAREPATLFRNSAARVMKIVA